MTGLEMIARIRANIHQANSEGAFSDAQLLGLLNEGLMDLCRYTLVKETQTTISAASYMPFYSLPSNYLKAKAYRWSYNKQLFTKNDRTLDYDQRDWMARVGTPENIVRRNYSTFRLTPIPSVAGTVTLRYAHLPDELANTADEPELPEIYQDALVDFGTAQAFFILRERTNALAYWQDYMKTRLELRSRGKEGFRGPDTMTTQRNVSVFTYGLWDQRYRLR